MWPAIAFAAAMVAGATIAPASAQVAPDVYQPAEIVSRHPETNGPMAGGAIAPAISARGHVIAFQAWYTSDAGDFDEPMYRHRPPGVTGFVEPRIGHDLGLSDDGCVIAYSRNEVYNVALRAFNRCTGAVLLLDSFYSPGGVDQIPAPGVSADGSVIAFAEPDYYPSEPWTIVIFRDGVRETTIEAPSSEPFIDDVSISDDGTVVAFSAWGVEPAYSTNVWVFDLKSAGLVLASRDAGGQPTSYSGETSISGDGSLVAFESSYSVHVFDRSTSSNLLVFDGAGSPVISRDGRYLVFYSYDAFEESFVSLVSSADRWRSSSPAELVSYARPGASGARHANDPVVSSHGRWVAWETRTVSLYVDDPAFGTDPNNYGDPQVVVRERRPVLEVTPVDYGALSAPQTRPVYVRNVGPAGWRVTSIETSGARFALVSENCPATLHPGEGCFAEVRYSPTGEGQQSGELIVRDESYAGVSLVASGRLVGVSDPEQPEPPPEPPPPVPPPVGGLTVAPNPVVFDEVVVGVPAAGRVVTVSNTGEVAVTVNSIGVSGGAAFDFSVVDDRCTREQLGVGESCPVELGFTASDSGGRTATLSVSATLPAAATRSLVGSVSGSTRLQGIGRYDGVLTVLPEVASGGQVVTVTGTGYPATTVVEVELGSGPPVSATTDAEGGFMQSWLVMSGTPQGELQADDVAVDGRYDAEPAQLIVISTPVRPQAVSIFNPTVRRHVSR